MQLFLSADFNIRTLRRTPKSIAQKTREWQEVLENHLVIRLSHILHAYIPQSLFNRHTQSTKTRRRVFSTENTFWAFFLQTLKTDCSCQSIVHQFRIGLKQKNKQSLSSSTSAYCQARKRLSPELLSDIFQHTRKQGEQLHPLVNRRVVCADGTGMTASDTALNQACWPQQATQKKGCGFPQIRLCGLFNLYSGVALSYQLGNKRSHELPLLREQESDFNKGDIFVGDKGFICFYDQARLLGLGVDSIVALSKRKPYCAQQADKCLGENDLLVTVSKPTSKSAHKNYPETVWETLPEQVQMRQVCVTISIPGYRSNKLYLLTTLLDHQRYPADLIVELYRQRWHVELYFRDLKSTLGMDILSGKSPDMVRKEIQMYFIVYNVIRLLMVASDSETPPNTLAFKSCIQTVMAYYQQDENRKSNRFLHNDLLADIAKCRLLHRPNRIEPRQVKRRPKPFKLMMKPRSEFKTECMKNLALGRLS